MSDCTWGCVEVVGSTLFGDVLGSVWQVGVIGTSKLRMFDGPSFAHVAKTLGERYSERGLSAAGDARGAVNRHSTHPSSGLEVTAADQMHQKSLSINSSVGVLSIQNVRTPEVKWPLVLGKAGEVREISTTEQCAVLRNKARWGAVLVRESAGVDAAWRSTPVSVWKEIIGELSSGFLYTPHYQSVGEGDIDADLYCFKHPPCGDEEHG